MSKQEENPRQKLENELVSLVQGVLGKPLNKDQLEQVHFLAYDVAHLGDARYTEVKPLDKDLESLLTVTGLKANQITSVTSLVASYHPDGPNKELVTSALETFGSAQGWVTPQQKLHQAVSLKGLRHLYP